MLDLKGKITVNLGNIKNSYANYCNNYIVARTVEFVVFKGTGGYVKKTKPKP